MDVNKIYHAERYKMFNEKIDSFAAHKDYLTIRARCNQMILENAGGGLGAILADDFITRIEKAPLWYIGEWLDGKNKLDWAEINRLNSGSGGK